MYSDIILYAPYIVIWQFCQSSNPDEVQESVQLGVEIGDLWHHWHPRASQGSLSQVLKCHHVACNGPVVRGSENRSAGDFVSPTKWNNLQTKYKNGMPTFQWSNSKNKWICWFLGPEKSQTWGFRLTESHRKDAINIGSPCEMWRPWRSSRTNPPTFIRRSPAGDVAGVASWPDDQRFGGLMLWCFQAWNLGRFPTSCSLLMKWSCHQVTNYAPLRSNKHTLQLEIPISWHMYQICIKSSPDGSPNRGYQYINIYICIYILYLHPENVVFQTCSNHQVGRLRVSPAVWCDGNPEFFDDPQGLGRGPNSADVESGQAMWHWPPDVGFCSKMLVTSHKSRGLKPYHFPSFQYKPTVGMMARYGKIWQVIVHPCVAIHIVPLCSWPPHAQVQNLSQWGPRSAAGVRPRGWQTAFWRAILQGQGMSTSPIHRTWHVVHIYIRCTHIIIYTRWFEVRTSHEPCASFVQQRKYKRGNLKYTIYPHV